MNTIDRYVLCYDQAVNTELSIPELFQIWEVNFAQGSHMIKTGSLIVKGKVNLN